MATSEPPAAAQAAEAAAAGDSKIRTPKLDAPQLQAGGGTAAATVDARTVDHLSENFTKYLKALYDNINKEYNLATKEGLEKWLASEQLGCANDVELLQDGSFANFAKYYMSGSANVMKSPPLLDESYPISNYFISSSHNTYLRGNQLSSEASVDGYKNVLMRGCRCVEIDVWDGEEPSDTSSSSSDEEATGPPKEKRKKSGLGLRKRLELRFRRKASPPPEEKEEQVQPAVQGEERITPWRSNSSRAEPMVTHGYTAVKETSFRAVCATIRDYAFTASDLPLIVSLEVHTSPEQQEIMVELMNHYWRGMLVDLPLDPSQASEEVTLPRLQDLKNKILVKVKRAPLKPVETPSEPTALQRPAALTQETTESDSMDDDLSDVPDAAPKPKPKVIEALSKLGVYAGGYHFKGFDQPEANIPTHIFSLSENTLMEVHETQPAALFKHNQHHFMRAYPKGTRISSSNLNPSLFWRAGVQIVALNWQRWDGGMMQNEGMFAGTPGWVLKPEGYRSTSKEKTQKNAILHHNLDLSIEFFAGQDIPLPPEEDDHMDFKPYIKVELHVEKHEEREGQPIPGGAKNKSGEYKKKTKTYRTTNPDFGREVISFEGVQGVTEELTFVRFKIMDDERLRDDLAAWACFRLDRLQPGLRMLHLYDSNGVVSKGVLFVRIKKTFFPFSASRFGRLRLPRSPSLCGPNCTTEGHGHDRGEGGHPLPQRPKAASKSSGSQPKMPVVGYESLKREHDAAYGKSNGIAKGSVTRSLSGALRKPLFGKIGSRE